MKMAIGEKMPTPWHSYRKNLKTNNKLFIKEVLEGIEISALVLPYPITIAIASFYFSSWRE